MPFFNASGVRLHYLDEGRRDAEAVVLVHGLIGDIDGNWVAPGTVARLVDDGFRMLALDCRGHGRSDRPIEPAAYGREMILDIVRLLDHLKIDTAHLVGYSMGAGIVGAVALKFPERARSVALLAGSPATRERIANDEAMRALMTQTVESLRRGDGLAPLFAYLAPHGRPRPLDAEMVARARDAMAGFDAGALAALIEPWWEMAVDEAALGENRVPMRAIVGRDDPNGWLVAHLEGRLTGLSTLWLDGADHGFEGCYPAAMDALWEFLQEQRRGDEG